MALLDTKDYVFVFDLDDTLYPESEYQVSGIAAVCAHLSELYGRDIADELAKKQSVDSDVLGAICNIAGLPVSAKESLLWIYRLHVPDIKLAPATSALVARLERDSRGVVVLTDGRSTTQRLKLRALGLAHLPVYISEEWGGVKPAPTRFKQIMLDYPAPNYVYVGDNPQKDFLGPNSLGWLTIGVRGNENNIHTQNCVELAPNFHPSVWIEKIDRLSEISC